MSTFSTKEFVFIHLKYCRCDAITIAFGNNNMIDYDYKYEISTIGYKYDGRCNVFKPPRHIGAAKYYKQPCNDGHIVARNLLEFDKKKRKIVYLDHPITWYNLFWADNAEIYTQNGGFADFNVWLKNMIDDNNVGLYTKYILESIDDDTTIVTRHNYSKVLNINIQLPDEQFIRVDDATLEKIKQIDSIYFQHAITLPSLE